MSKACETMRVPGLSSFISFGIIRADESVSGAERIFLAQLANQLGLDPETVTKLEADTSARIEAQD